MNAWFLVVLLSVTSRCHGVTSEEWLRQLPWATRDNLLHLQPHLELTQLTDAPTPLFRPDMGTTVAYWYITYNNDHHAILSAGDHTDDNKLILQGQGESPFSAVQQLALRQHNVACQRYYVMTPSPALDLACDTSQGRVMKANLQNQNVTAMWEEKKAKKKLADKKLLPNDVSPDSPDVIHFDVITSSQPASFPVLGMLESYIRPMSLGNGSDVSVDVLCRLLDVCDSQGRVHAHRKTEYGEVYVHLEPVHEHRLPKIEHDVHFVVMSLDGEGGVQSKRYVYVPSHRSKRQSSPYTQYAIDDEVFFPDYNQFEYDGCQVGCGPVAWAQIFGFYDRRAQARSGSPLSSALYRCGDDATTGSNDCQAPKYLDPKMRKYIAKLHDILGTFCLSGQGATFQTSMDDVKDFYKSRQGPAGDIILKTRSNILTQLVGVYSDDIRDDALSFVRQKWPVVVGFRVDGIFSQHYPVMTQFRTRMVTKQVCTLSIFCSTKTVQEYDMYLHMGWGGSHNGWRTAEMFMAAVATY